MRFRIALVVAVLAAALLLPGLARAADGQGTATDAALLTTNGFSDGNGGAIVGSTNGFSDGNGGAVVWATFGMSDGNG
jgi:hypothetical protein